MEIKQILSRNMQPGNNFKIPLVELAGHKRVLIENHLGVVAYSTDEIQIKVSYGKLSVVGQYLRFMQINKDQLVINGQIESIHLFRR